MKLTTLVVCVCLVLTLCNTQKVGDPVAVIIVNYCSSPLYIGFADWQPHITGPDYVRFSSTLMSIPYGERVVKNFTAGQDYVRVYASETQFTSIPGGNSTSISVHINFTAVNNGNYEGTFYGVYSDPTTYIFGEILGPYPCPIVPCMSNPCGDEFENSATQMEMIHMFGCQSSYYEIAYCPQDAPQVSGSSGQQTESSSSGSSSLLSDIGDALKDALPDLLEGLAA